MVISKMAGAQPVPKAGLLQVLTATLRSRGLTSILASIAAVVLAALAYQRKRFARNVKYLKGDPIIGVLRKVVGGLFNFHVHDDFVGYHKALGKTFAGNLGGVCMISTVDPRNLEHILKTNFDNYIKGTVFTDPLTDLLGDGVFN